MVAAGKVLLQAVVAVIATMMTEENMKKLADAMLDTAEDFVQKTDNTIDDAVVLPAIAKIRSVFNIPDNDEPAPPAEQPE